MHILKIIGKKYRYFIDKKHFNSNHESFALNGTFQKNSISDFIRIYTLFQ